MTRIQKSLIGVLLLTLGLLTYHYQKGVDLYENHSTTTGKYIRYHRGVKTGGGLEFSYTVDGKSYKEMCCQHLPTACETGLMGNEEALRQYTFIVAYDKTDHSNAELLVVQSQYDRFELTVPKELKEVIEIISKCE